MKIEYTKYGDYLLPHLALKPQSNENIGKYGLLRLDYLKLHKKAFYQELLMKDKLTSHLFEIDKLATTKIKNFVSQLAEEQNVNEKLKTTNQLCWVGMMNNIKNQAEEMVLNELVYI